MGACGSVEASAGDERERLLMRDLASEQYKLLPDFLATRCSQTKSDGGGGGGGGGRQVPLLPETVSVAILRHLRLESFDLLELGGPCRHASVSSRHAQQAIV